jgi:hypothetical protein
MVYTVIYGLMLAAVMLLSWQSANHIIQKLSLLMLLSWFGSTALVDLLGFARAPMDIPMFNAVVAIMAALLGIKHSSRVCLAVVALFVVEETINLGAFVCHQNGSYDYYAALNGIFVLRMAVVGGAACVGLVGRLARRDPLGLHGRLSF